MESDKAPPRAAKILCGLGFSPADQAKKTKYLNICIIFETDFRRVMRLYFLKRIFRWLENAFGFG